MKKTLLIILGVLAVAIIAGGVWYYLDNKNKTENRACTMEAKLCPDGSYVGRVAPNCEFAECPAVNEFKDWKTYRNKEYGFELKFPDTWKGYTVKERILNWGSAGTSPSYDFGFSIQESLFNISMHTKDQWVKISSEEGPIPEILGQNDEYVFAQAMGQYAANDQMIERRNEISQILSTFKFID